MMSDKILAASKVLDAMHMEYETKQFGDQTELQIPREMESGEKYVIKLIGKENKDVMGLYVFGLYEDVPIRMCRRLLPLLNELNDRYRYFRFYFDDDGDINMAYDFPDKSPAPHKSVKEAIRRLKSILGEAYPMLKEALEKGQ